MDKQYAYKLVSYPLIVSLSVVSLLFYMTCCLSFNSILVTAYYSTDIMMAAIGLMCAINTVALIGLCLGIKRFALWFNGLCKRKIKFDPNKKSMFGFNKKLLNKV